MNKVTESVQLLFFLKVNQTPLNLFFRGKWEERGAVRGAENGSKENQANILIGLYINIGL